MNTHITAQDPIPMGVNPEAWLEWEEFRRVGKKKKITTFAARKQFRLLEQHDYPTQQQIIDNSIQNDYQGLFPVKQKEGKHETYQQPTQRTSAVGRVKQNIERRQRERAERSACGNSMGEAISDVRVQVLEPVRGGTGQDVGNLLEGDFWQTDG